MKKLLLILLCLPMIGFGQDSYEKSCWKITKKLDKFDDIIKYDSPIELPISFTKVIDNENNIEEIYLGIKVIGYTANAFIKGVKVLLDNGEKLSWPNEEIDSRVNNNAKIEYSAFVTLNKQEIAILKEHYITDVRLYIYDKEIESPLQYRDYLMCIDENKSKEDYKKPEIEETESDDDEVFMVVENMPEFPGGDLGLMKYIQKNVRYPPIAKEYNITGKVYVSFIVDKTGSVTNIKVIRGVDKDLDAEAVRVIKSLPKYKPGKQRGKPARVMLSIPVNFTLN